jgi:hypothetical protein
MINKVLVILGLVLLNINLILAIPSISINNVYSTDREYLPKSVAQDTGDHLIAEITVSDNTWQNIKQVYLAWGDSSWVDCNKINTYSSSIDYKCILTVTPYMNGLTKVYIMARDYEGLNRALLGTYDFKGQLFPEYGGTTIQPTPIIIPITRPNYCPQQQVCTGYEKVCEKVCVRQSPRTGYCYSYKNVCQITDNCIRYSLKRVCPR